jgi:hypothetical protein
MQPRDGAIRVQRGPPHVLVRPGRAHCPLPTDRALRPRPRTRTRALRFNTSEAALSDPVMAELYRVAGLVLSSSLFHGIETGVQLPLLIYKKLLGHKPTLADLAQWDPTLAQSLRALMDYDGDVEPAFCLDFTVNVREPKVRLRRSSLR